MTVRRPRSTLFPYTTLFRSEFIVEVLDPATLAPAQEGELVLTNLGRAGSPVVRYRTGDRVCLTEAPCACGRTFRRDRKSTRLNSSHSQISYAVFCLKKKNNK